jgi:mannosyl-oligosaccharide alpha-1,2-mannosidase
VDGLDTLFIMGLHDEYEQGRRYVANELNLADIDSEISIFEMNIRFVGGLLSCYALTKDPIYLTKAEELAQNMLIAFDTPTGIPNAIVNPKQSNFLFLICN